MLERETLFDLFCDINDRFRNQKEHIRCNNENNLTNLDP